MSEEKPGRAKKNGIDRRDESDERFKDRPDPSQPDKSQRDFRSMDADNLDDDETDIGLDEDDYFDDEESSTAKRLHRNRENSSTHSHRR